MSAARVSVILPTYNRAALLRRAVDSVLNQTWRDLELIIVDDASTDDTAAVLSGINDDRAQTIRLASNRGAPAARNAGIVSSHGDLLAFLDSDDVWSPQKLERQVAALDAASDRAGLCVCSLDVNRGHDAFSMVWPDEEAEGSTALDRILGGTGYATPTWLARRDAIESAGDFDECLPRLQDYELTLRIASRWNLVTMSDVLVTMNVQDDSLSSSADGYAAAIESILNKHADAFAKHPRGHSHMVFRAGKYFAIEGRRHQALTWFRRALAIQPGNMRALAGWALCATGLVSLFTRMKYGR